MKDTERRAAAKSFADYWKDKGYEKGQSQVFWLELLQKVYGVETPGHYIKFEDQVMMDHTAYIDGYIEDTRVLIEQKSSDKDLRKAIKQSDGSMLTPFQQAKRYIVEMPVDKHPKWVITCNFQQFLVYDMNKPNGEPEEILLKNLPNEYYRLDFLVDKGNTHLQKEMEVSIQAGELVGKLYDALLKQYADPEASETLKSLNMLCVRLVFCLYAEDSGIFGRKGMFFDYMKQFSAKQWRKNLIELFQVLDTPEDKRDKYMEDDLAAFPYVNGGLFADEEIEIPNFTDEIIDLILNQSSKDFDWSQISPTIFGACFESTLNPETRRSGGMHYTSIENIHKVIDPLFLDGLKEELQQIKDLKTLKTKESKLKEFQNKLASLTFLDPACGSGNFLTETYLSLRKLENEVLSELHGEQIVLGDLGSESPIKVQINQFYGIEINDFAVKVGKTALWIAESQMMKKTEDIVHMDLDFLPLKSYVNIIEENALKYDWNRLIPKQNLDYIMGNPPFIGKKEQTKTQKQEILDLFPKKTKGVGNLDYVSGWYKKAADYIALTDIRVAFVSTNSITQGEQASILWKVMFNEKTYIDFAFQTFIWDSETTNKAHVHCVIIGFSNFSKNKKAFLYTDSVRKKSVENINQYLLDAPSIMIESRSKSICSAPPIVYGSMPIDEGNLILGKEDVHALLEENTDNARFIKKYVGGLELLQNKDRWCLWLKDISPNEYKYSRLIMQRIEKTAQFRKSSTRPQTLELASKPMLFGEIRQPNSKMLVIPKVSSENRRYIPMCYLTPDVIVNGSALIIPDASLYHFGVLMSNVHNSWMRVVAGRLEMRYQYSAQVVYNNFPWPNPTEDQMKKISSTAKAILDARSKYPGNSLSDMYGEHMYLYPELLEAHRANDKAVMEAYGFWKKLNTESECVAELMKMYQALV